MDILTLLIVGLVAGVLASAVFGGVGFGVLGDIAIGIAGSFVGSYTFRAAGWHAPVGGLAGTCVIAFVGAVIVLAAVLLLRRAFAGPRAI